MPFSSIAGARSAKFPTSLHDAKLSLAQINHLARIHDGIKEQGSADNPMAVAFAQFQELYHKEGDAWVRNKKSEKLDKAEHGTEEALSGDTNGMLLADWDEPTRPTPTPPTVPDHTHSFILKVDFDNNNFRSPFANIVGITSLDDGHFHEITDSSMMMTNWADHISVDGKRHGHKHFLNLSEGQKEHIRQLTEENLFGDIEDDEDDKDDLELSRHGNKKPKKPGRRFAGMVKVIQSNDSDDLLLESDKLDIFKEFKEVSGSTYPLYYTAARQRAYSWMLKQLPSPRPSFGGQSSQVVVDLFAGGGILSWGLKHKGYKVLSNDLTEYSYICRKALCENNEEVLSDSEIIDLFKSTGEDNIIPEGFFNYTVRRELSDIWFNAQKLNSEYKKAMAMSIGTSAAISATRMRGLSGLGAISIKNSVWRRNKLAQKALISGDCKVFKADPFEFIEAIKYKADAIFVSPPHSEDLSDIAKGFAEIFCGGPDMMKSYRDSSLEDIGVAFKSAISKYEEIWKDLPQYEALIEKIYDTGAKIIVMGYDGHAIKSEMLKRRIESNDLSCNVRTINLNDFSDEDIESNEGDSEMAEIGKILKLDKKRQIAIGPVLVPGIKDKQGDIVSKEVIEDAFYNYMLNFQHIGIMHEDFTKDKDLIIVEAYLMPADVRLKGNNGKLTLVPEGTWMQGVKFDDDTWARVEKGEITGWSIGGDGKRIPRLR